VEDYYRSNEPISLKLGVLIGPYQLEELINFGGDPHSGSLFHFPHHEYGILGDLLAFLIQSPADCHDTR